MRCGLTIRSSYESTTVSFFDTFNGFDTTYECNGRTDSRVERRHGRALHRDVRQSIIYNSRKFAQTLSDHLHRCETTPPQQRPIRRHPTACPSVRLSVTASTALCFAYMPQSPAHACTMRSNPHPQICIKYSRFITCQSNTSKGRGHDRLPN